MSTYTVIQEVSFELRRRIHQALSTAPDAVFNLATPETDITLSPPPEPSAGPPLVSLYLYHILPDAHLRNQERLSVGADSLRYPPITVQLYYLVTPLLDEEDQNQLIVGRILQAFHDEPVVRALDGTPLDNSFGAATPALRVELETLTLEELTRIWHALTSSYRLSLSYRVRVVAIDSAQVEIEAKRALRVHTVVGIKDA